MAATEQLARELVSLVRGLRELNHAVADAGGYRLDVAAAAVLARIGDEGPLRLSSLAERLCVDLSTVSRQVAQLERAGWTTRSTDPSDRRATLLALTDAGAQVLEETRRTRAAVLARALPDWTDADLSELAGLLARFNADLADHRAAAVAGTRTSLDQSLDQSLDEARA